MIRVFDAVLPDPMAYRAMALAQPFRSVELALGVVFHGIAPCLDPTLPARIVRQFPGLTPTLSFFRQSPEGQIEPNYVHTDRDMGDWTAILYLNPDPPEGDGTVFWRHKATGALESVTDDAEALLDEQQAWRDRAQWEAIEHVDAKLNRVLLFAAPRFHSRAILENYGAGSDARLIQVVFGTGTFGEE